MKLLSAPQAAERLNLSAAMVRRYCQQGKLYAYKINRDWVIPEQSVTDFARTPRKVGYPKGKPRKVKHSLLP